MTTADERDEISGRRRPDLDRRPVERAAAPAGIALAFAVAPAIQIFFSAGEATAAATGRPPRRGRC